MALEDCGDLTGLDIGAKGFDLRGHHGVITTREETEIEFQKSCKPSFHDRYIGSMLKIKDNHPILYKVMKYFDS